MECEIKWINSFEFWSCYICLFFAKFTLPLADVNANTGGIFFIPLLFIVSTDDSIIFLNSCNLFWFTAIILFRRSNQWISWERIAVKSRRLQLYLMMKTLNCNVHYKMKWVVNYKLTGNLKFYENLKLLLSKTAALLMTV